MVYRNVHKSGIFLLKSTLSFQVPEKITFVFWHQNQNRPKYDGCTFRRAKLGWGHGFGNEWKHISPRINFYNRCVFIRYSEANAIKWPKPILFAARLGGTIPNSNVTSTDRAQTFCTVCERRFHVTTVLHGREPLIKPITSGQKSQFLCRRLSLCCRDGSTPRLTQAACSTDIHTYIRTYIHTHSHTHSSSSLLQPREVMKTNGRVLFPLGLEEELSHQANFILVWPRDSISSGCFYKRWAAPRHRPVMDMRAWWPDGRCWLCNSSSKQSLMTPLAPEHPPPQCNAAVSVLSIPRPRSLHKEIT